MSDAFRRALQVQQAAAADGFDWPDDEGLWAKLAEEAAELREAATPAHRHEELGDLLFMVANIARHLGLDPETALRDAVSKFERRYAPIAAARATLPPPGDPARLAAMEALWQQAKAREKAGGA